MPMSRNHGTSSTAHVLTELQLYGWRPYEMKPISRPLPEGSQIAGAVADILDALVATLGDTRLEPDLDELLWGAVNLFHRALARAERQLDDNEQAQRRLQREQDGSEVKSLELERLVAEGQSMVERRTALELFRDLAADGFEHHLGKTWHPRTGSRVSHRNLTAAMIDSRDFLAARRRAEAQLLLPEGPKVAVTGGADFNDHRLIWARLDRVYAKHPDMVLLHGGSPKGSQSSSPPAGPINRKVLPQSPSAPDWTKHGPLRPVQSATKRDGWTFLPIGVLVFPGHWDSRREPCGQGPQAWHPRS